MEQIDLQNTQSNLNEKINKADSSTTSILYQFPVSAKFESVISKNKIYEHTRPSTRTKSLFINEVEKIIWSYKLSSTTINLPSSHDVKEIQIITILLKTESFSQDILYTIDKAIPSPILFELKYGDKIKYSASYKRPNDADKSKWVVSPYYTSTEYTELKESHFKELPIALDMKSLYEALLLELIPTKKRKHESLQQLMNRVEEAQNIQSEIGKLYNRILKENQYKYKVELNHELNIKKKILQELT